MIKEDPSYASPIATIFYEYYNTLEEVKTTLEKDKESIQCVVSNGVFENEVAFGETQNPKLWEYADGINTLAFLADFQTIKLT
jgi:hypothetical protein